MESYLFWLVLLALAIISASVMQTQARAGRRLKEDCGRLQSDIDLLQGRLREKETALDRLQHRLAQMVKWRARAEELEAELKAAKQSQDYASAARLKFLEDSLTTLSRGQSPEFLATIPIVRSISPIRSQNQAFAGSKRFEECLQNMLREADFEVIIVSPWIKRQAWNKMAAEWRRFASRGGRLRIFMRGSLSDYSLGLADDLQEDISNLGGELVLVPRLHAKIYMADRKHAIIASANLTRGGTEDNFESGLMVDDPRVLSEICDFIDEITARAA